MTSQIDRPAFNILYWMEPKSTGIMKKLLLIIDPQNDFINGSLPVPGAEEAMNALSRYIKDHSDEYEYIVVTADQHPRSHCSFKENGGVWRAHCIVNTYGADIWAPLSNILKHYSDKLIFLSKGDNSEKEEYSIFKNDRSASKLLNIIKSQGIEQVDICGIAGDICVADTIRDGISVIYPAKFNILAEFTPSIDGGKTIKVLIQKL